LIAGIGGGGGAGMISQAGFGEKFDVVVEEVNQLWSFVQRFIDEHVVDGIDIIRSGEHSIREKMNQMEWLARNAEFLSPDSITKTLLAFKELYNTDRMNQKNAFITAKHTSGSVITVMHLLEHTKQLTPRDDEAMSRLAIISSILEPLLINDLNLDKAVEARIMDLLISLLYVPEEVKVLASDTDPDAARKLLPVYLKYTLRCITSCVRSPLGVADFSKSTTSIAQILEFLEFVRDEEILANSAKVLRIVLRDDKHYERLTGLNQDIGNILLECVQRYAFSEVVMIELLAALRNFTRSPAKVPLVSKTNLSTIVSLALQPPNDKLFQMAAQCLRNFAKIPDYERHIK
jgi:hypothetical protein